MEPNQSEIHLFHHCRIQQYGYKDDDEMMIIVNDTGVDG
jgi:hypothetical protein